MAWYYDGAKEWGALGSWALVPSNITYEPKRNSSTVQGGEDQGRSAEGEWNSRWIRVHDRISPRGKGTDCERGG